MTDNVIYPPFPPQPGQVGGGGGGPHLPEMEPRVATLEADMKDVKSSLKDLRESSIRVEAMLANMSTKTDQATTAGAINTLSEKVVGLTTRVGTAESAISGKMIGPWQVPAILGACIGLFVAGVAAYNWVVTHIGTSH